MPNQANSYAVLPAIRTLLEGLSVGGSNPLSTFTASDQTKYGTTHAIYLIPPKIIQPTYTHQAHIVPPHPAWHDRHSYGGKVWAYHTYGIVLLYNATQNEVQVVQDLLNAGDALGLLMSQHAEMPGAPIVQASKVVESGPVPSGWFIDERIGREWQCWGANWWVKQEYYVPGGIVP